MEAENNQLPFHFLRRSYKEVRKIVQHKFERLGYNLGCFTSNKPIQTLTDVLERL